VSAQDNGKSPHAVTSTRSDTQFKLQPELSELIDEYINDYRPALLRGSTDLWLFPGQKRAIKNSRTLSLQVTQRVMKDTGLRITVHQFRHAAAAIFLKHRPGQYELVRQILGHKNIQTTMDFYVGLENIQATEIFGDIIKQRLNKLPEAAE
jgi:integrase